LYESHWAEFEPGATERLTLTVTAADVEALSLVTGDVEAFHLRQAALGHDGSAPGARRCRVSPQRQPGELSST
jgi:hypothetical protein